MDNDNTLYSEPVGSDEVRHLERVAQYDDFAAEKLARCYMSGNGVKPDSDKALYWFTKSKSSLARYACATIYIERGDYIRAEKECLCGLDTDDSLAYGALCTLLGKLYLSGKTTNSQPDYNSAAEYLEKGISFDPEIAYQYVGYLGMAYEGAGQLLRAVHWYRKAVEEFGQVKYQDNLYRIYLTGIAGNEKKNIAEKALCGGMIDYGTE